jgi:hypothetical protein
MLGKNNSGARCHSSGLVATITPVVLLSKTRDQVSSVFSVSEAKSQKSGSLLLLRPRRGPQLHVPYSTSRKLLHTTLDAHFKGCLFAFCLRGANRPYSSYRPRAPLVMPETTEKNDRASGLNLAEVCNLDS